LINGKTILAIIPARGGSKRLPRKNIMELAGKPLIAWTIKAALYSKYIDKVVVSSDSPEILDVSKKYGANTIKRPLELATDIANSFDTVKHTIENLNDKFDVVILLQPTSPLRTQKHIDEAFKLMSENNADAIISISETIHSPLLSNTLPINGSMDNFLSKSVLNKRSQDLKKYYCLNGAIYICKVDVLMGEKTFFIINNIFAYKMDRENSVDIDNITDFRFAEYLMTEKNKI
jgi:CMP-N,N'-diacetyllegionaminic acid synthase